MEVGEPGLELAGFEVAGLEGLVVAVERAFAAADLLDHAAEVLLERGPVCLLLVVGALECVCDQVAVLVEAGELVEDGGFEFVAVEAFAVAAFAAELLPARAGVVVVDAAVSFCAHADVGALAAAAADHAGEQKVGAVAAPQCQVLAPLAQEGLGLVEGVLVDERLVQARVALAAPVHPAEVGLVLEQPLDDGGLPAARRRWGVLVGEQSCDRGRAQALARVQLEDAAYDGRLSLVGDDVFVVVSAVAEGELAGRPAALLGATFDPGGDAVDDGRVLELREHRQHLQHHPPRRRARVERLGRRAQRHPGPVELVGQLGKLADLSREPVDAVDQQQIDLPRPGELERRLQAGPVQLRASGAIFLVGDDPPTLLRAHERLEPLALAVQGGRLVLLVGRDPRVDANAQRHPPPPLSEISDSSRGRRGPARP
ncbi:MAG TPA: hypothetical protein VMT59_14290 [Gaiellaceae bacterium]|nr:hypothetical protein [Gaiellaceae bacterium]